MARGVQITIVASMQDRCHFVDSLNGITLGIFFENEGIHLLKYLVPIFEVPGTAWKTSEFDHVEIIKQIKNHPIF